MRNTRKSKQNQRKCCCSFRWLQHDMTTSTSAIFASSNSSSSTPVVPSSSPTTSIFKAGSFPTLSSSGAEPVATKSSQDAGVDNLSSTTAFGSSTAAFGSIFCSSSVKTLHSQSRGSVIGPTASSGSVLGTQARPATSGFAPSTLIQSVSFGSSASSPSFGLTRSTPFSPGNSSFSSSSPATNAAFSSGSSLFASSSPATNAFNSGSVQLFGAANSVSSNSRTSSAGFGSSSWRPSMSPFGSSSSSGFSFGASTASTSAPTMFLSTTQFSLSSAVATTSAQPAFGSPSPVFTFGSAPVDNNDQMTMEDSMDVDTIQTNPPAAAVFGQQPTPVQSNFVFGASTPSGATPFRFGGQQNIAPQNHSLFQASGSLRFNAAGSFFFGSGGGDKSGRKFLKVKHGKRKK